MENLFDYGVGPWTEYTLRHYCQHLTMVAQEGKYYSTPLKGYHGVIQGDPIYPNISNMVVDAVIRYWVAVVEEE